MAPCQHSARSLSKPQHACTVPRTVTNHLFRPVSSQVAVSRECALRQKCVIVLHARCKHDRNNRVTQVLAQFPPPDWLDAAPLDAYKRDAIFANANMKTKAATRVDLMFRACSDRTRLRLLSLLGGGELCVCDLVDIVGVPQPKVSRHLAYLRRAGLVVARKEGLWNYYKLAPARSAFHKTLLDCLAHCELPELARDAARLACKGGSCC